MTNIPLRYSYWQWRCSCSTKGRGKRFFNTDAKNDIECKRVTKIVLMREPAKNGGVVITERL